MQPRRVNDGFQYTAKSAMRDQIKILAPSPARNLDGSPYLPYLFADNVWAYIRAMRPTEVNTKELVQSEVFYDIRIPFVAGITSQMSIVAPSGAIWFIVNAVDPDQRQVELRIVARSINDGAVQNLDYLPTPPPTGEADIDGGNFNEFPPSPYPLTYEPE